MIIPVKCVTCGKVIANKYRFFLEQVRKKKLDKISLRRLKHPSCTTRKPGFTLLWMSLIRGWIKFNRILVRHCPHATSKIVVKGAI